MSSKLKTEWDKDKSLEFIQIRYTDVLGKFLARYLSKPADIESFFKHGIGLDGSSVRGFAHIDDSDLLILPDKTTARTVPLIMSSINVIEDLVKMIKGFFCLQKLSQSSKILLLYFVIFDIMNMSFKVF
jgi:glutamine synthetase